MRLDIGSVVRAVRREPALSGWTLKFGLCGALLVSLWTWLGTFVLSDVYVVLITLVSLLAYGSVLALMFGSIMYGWNAAAPAQVKPPRSLDKWAPRRDSRSELPSPETPVRPRSHSPSGPAVFHEAYFRQRLAEEVASARREAREMSLIWLEVGGVSREPAASGSEQIAAEVAELLAGQARETGQVLATGSDEFVFSLPDAGATASRAFASNLVQALGNYWCNCGIAVYPGDAGNGDALMRSAREACEASRMGAPGRTAGKKPVLVP